jgi:hypothetical protein
MMAIVVALGAGTIGAAPAQAADLGTITVTGANDPYSYSPITLTGAVGDTFRVVNATTGGDTVNVGTTPGVDTGIVSVGVLACDPIGTQASCIALSGPGTTYTITGLGTISITYTSGGSEMPIGPILLQAAGGGAVTDPALVYPTASIDANGGTCTGSTQYIKYQGQNAASGIFTAPTADTCTRTNFSLAGWARSATGSVEWQPGSTVPIGDEGFTLFAVWRPNGIELVYDANVGLETQCLSANGTNVTTAAERQTTPTVVPTSSAVAAQAPCTPSGHTLIGWSLTGSGPTTLVKGAALPASFSGTSQTLYAKWEPDRFDLSVQVDSFNSAELGRALNICAGVSQLVTFTATKNGVAAAGQIIDVQTLPTGRPPTTQSLTTDDLGRVQVSITLDPNFAPLVVNGSLVNQVATLVFNARDPRQCVTRSITITGERTTVSGKPGIMVNGTTTGFKKDETVVPYIRFPGETTFTQGSARPEIGDDGFFSWSRKTGKKIYVYVTSADGKVTSNRVIISAN